jgi:hypothetical protein
MITKTFELRDRATFVPVLAIRLEPGCEADRYLFGRAGFTPNPDRQREYIMLCGLNGGRETATCDPHDWPNRTRQEAHKYIREHFEELESGAVVDVEYILGETASPKRSEAREAW